MSKNLIQALERFASATLTTDGQIVGLMREDFVRAREALSRHRSIVESVELPEDEVVAWRDDGQQAANGPLHLCYRVVTSETLASMPRAAAAAYTEALYTASTVRSLIAAAVEREREECAKACEDRHANGNHKHDTREECAAAIRARGEMK